MVSPLSIALVGGTPLIVLALLHGSGTTRGRGATTADEVLGHVTNLQDTVAPMSSEFNAHAGTVHPMGSTV